MIKEVIFDLETKKLFSEVAEVDPQLLGVSVVSLYIREINDRLEEVKGEMISFWEDEFPKMWEHFQYADRIVGFNSLKFDVPALLPYATFPFHKLPHFDIMDEAKKVVGRRISLDAYAKTTLGRKKIDSGLNAVLYWKKGDKESLHKLVSYCEEDVLITKDLYDFGLNNKFIRYKDRWNTEREIEVDFSHKKKEDSQSTLF